MSNPFQTRSTLYEQPANFAGALGGMYGGFGQGFGNLGQGLAAGYSGISQGNAMAEAARQGALSNIASSMLSNYGSAANSAFGAYTGQQTAYMKALSDMHNSNQSAAGQLGQSRNGALAGLADAYANAGSSLGRASAIGDLGLNFSGDGQYGDGGSISANDGEVLSGTYTNPASGSSVGMSGSAGGQVPAMADQTFAGLAATGASMNSPAYLNAVLANGQDGLNRLDNQQYSSRYMPFQALQSLYPQMMSMGSMGIGSSDRGMNQFYGNQGSVLSGLGQMGSDISGRMSDGMNRGADQIIDLFNDSIGERPEFMSPAEQYRRMAEGQQERSRMNSFYWDRNLQSGQDHLVPLWYRKEKGLA